MTIDVWHMGPNLTFAERLSVTFPDVIGQQIAAARRLFTNGLYTQVATVNTDLMSIAWRLTHNAATLENISWSIKPDARVTLVAFNGNGKNGNGKPSIDQKILQSIGLRSSEIGDIFIHEGVSYVVSMPGFNPMEAEATG